MRKIIATLISSNLFIGSMIAEPSSTVYRRVGGGGGGGVAIHVQTDCTFYYGYSRVAQTHKTRVKQTMNLADRMHLKTRKPFKMAAALENR